MKDNYNLKKVVAFVISIAVVCGAFMFFANSNSEQGATNEVFASDSETTIVMEIDNPVMKVNGQDVEIDPGYGTAPLIVEGRTLVPIRSVIENIGGEVAWNEDTREVTLSYNDNVIVLTIDSTETYLNGEANTLDVAPTIINSRTMLPLRFIAESFNFDVNWNGESRTIEITKAIDTVVEESSEATSEATVEDSSQATPVVYMTTDISPEGLMNVYNMLGFQPEGNVAIKLSTGEPPASHYLDPNLIKDLVQSVDGTIVECNTAYGGSRASTAMHKQVAEDHGFTAIADVDIMDEEGYMPIPVANGENIQENYVGTHLANYDSMITLSHFKGHAMGGFGGAIKNMSIGVASREGKMWIHTGGQSMETWQGGDQDSFLESMAEATSSVVDYFDGKIVYVNVMNNLSVDCDCNGHPADPEMQDVGILASTDPVALDQACIDIVYDTPREESGALIERIESRNGIHTIEHAEKIGLGSRTYELVSID